MDLLPIRPVEFDRALNTGQIGWKFIVCLPGQIGYHPNEFNWHLSQWIYSQFNQALNTGQIGWKFIVCLPGRIGYHPNEFNWHLSQWIYSQFDWSNSTRHY